MIARTMPTYHALGSSRNSQSGGALLVMLVILVIGITTAFVTSLSSTAINNKRNQTTAEALAQAKEALIGYAVTYGDDPVHVGETDGYLPCPDMDGTAGVNPEGSSETCGNAGENTLGRLPWKTLKLMRLFDGAQECLWYVVSGNYKNNPKSGLPTMNWDTPAQLKVYSAEGVEIAPGEIVALVIAPGVPVSGNLNRAESAAPICGGNYIAAAYLENDILHGHDNTNVAAGEFILPHQHGDANGNVTLTVNDQFAIITRQDIWQAVEQRVAREAARCLADYAATATASGKYPLPAAAINPEMPALFGRIAATPNIAIHSQLNLDMVVGVDALVTALNVFKADKTAAKLAPITVNDGIGETAKDAAKDVKDYYDGHSSEDPSGKLEDEASNLKSAANNAMDLTTASSDATINGILQNISDAYTLFGANLTTTDGTMPTSWTASCNLFGAERWNHWKNHIFVQIANGFKPGSGSSPGCGSTCMDIQGAGGTAIGPGDYRAVVVGAGKQLGASRTTTNVADYLESDNLLPQTNVSNPYKTYRRTDTEYQGNNDLVLCLNGTATCP